MGLSDYEFGNKKLLSHNRFSRKNIVKYMHYCSIFSGESLVPQFLFSSVLIYTLMSKLLVTKILFDVNNCMPKSSKIDDLYVLM